MRHLLGINDLTDDEVARLLLRARELAHGAGLNPPTRPAIIGLLFLEPSLRTRLGFATAAVRLGHQAVSVAEQRPTAEAFAESWEDTVRVASGYCDMLVARPGRPLVASLPARCPVLNGGDTGAAAEHPSQALIDIFAIEHLRGRVEELAVAIIGDVRMRAARSLLALLSRRPPRRTVVITHPTLMEGLALETRAWLSVDNDVAAAQAVDVVYVAGMPHGSIDLESRRSLVVGEALLRNLAPDAVILSPMPVLDEVDPVVRADPRARFHEQSDLGLFARMALLELALEDL